MNWLILVLGSVTAVASAELIQQHLLNSKITVSPRTSGILTFLVQAILGTMLFSFFVPQI